jgi:hypothetical protein
VVRVRLLPFADFASATELDMTLDEIALWVESTESSQPADCSIWASKLVICHSGLPFGLRVFSMQ